jgi:hypothetical protein
MISESLGAVWAVESLRRPCYQFAISSLIISESLGAVSGVQSMRPRDISALMISESLGAVWAVESLCRPCYQFVDDF